jgi:hypothetical protein
VHYAGDQERVELAKIADDPEALQEALDAGALDIDAAFSTAGYVTPLDLSPLTEPALGRWTAKLALVNVALAARFLSGGTGAIRGQAGGVELAYKDARDFLDRISEGRVTVPGLARVLGGTGLRVVGDATYDQEAVDTAHKVRRAGELIGSTGSVVGTI